MNESHELLAALRAAARASETILDHYRSFQAIADAPASITTQADRDAQEVILQSLAAEFPNDAFRAEEATPSLEQLPRRGDRLWVIDPIDGTRGFARKNGEFSIMIALVVRGEPVVGVVWEPAIDRSTFAARGQGCWLRTGANEPRQVRVSPTRQLAEATLILSHVRGGPASSAVVQVLQPRAVRESYSAGIKLARVASGDADLYISTYDMMNDWDLAAGHALVEEAGGQVSNLLGQPLVYGREEPGHPGGLLASNGLVQEEAGRRLARTP